MNITTALALHYYLCNMKVAGVCEHDALQLCHAQISLNRHNASQMRSYGAPSDEREPPAVGKVAAITRRYKLRAVIQGDPRGAALRIVFPDGGSVIPPPVYVRGNMP